MIILGNSIQVMAAMKPNSIDAIVTDPPYGLEFMGKAWDAPWKPSGFDARTRDNAGQVTGAYARTLDRAPAKYRAGRAFQDWCEEWGRVAFEVLKPGGYMVAFGGTRTHHRLWSGIEDAGFEIRDTLMYLYGSGFPKSKDVAQAIDAGLGAERSTPALDATTGDVYGEGINVNFRDRPKPAPVTDEAKAWDGWGTALKPGWEPILLARKSPDGPVWRNVLEWGTGAINIGATRLPRAAGDRTKYGVDGDEASRPGYGGYGANTYEAAQGGRWPANVIVTHSPDCEHLGEKRVKSRSPAVPDPALNGEGGKTYGFKFGTGRRNRQSDFHMTEGSTGYADDEGLETVEAWACEPGCPVRLLDEQSGVSVSTGGQAAQVGLQGFRGGVKAVLDCQPGYGDQGGASRFFYTAKASTSERNAWGRMPDRNGHPTVKPLELMAWLVRLVGPPGGLILDPFAGSGSTLVAAKREGFRGLGIELDPVSARTARDRLRAQWEVKLL